MATKTPANAVPEGSPAPGYFFFGEETYLADVFLRDLQAQLIPADVPDFHIDVFYLDETGWGEILDSSRSMTLFFSPWRIIIVRLPEKADDPDKKDKEATLISAADAKLLKAYFAEPPARTVVVIIYPGKVRKSGPVARFFASQRGVVSREVKRIREWEAGRWLENKARTLGKAVTPEAAKRLLEIVGVDLRLMDNEIDKLAIYVGDKKTIDIGDVNQASAWVREFDPFELGNALETADLRECLIVLDNSFKTQEKPEMILFRFVSFFRDILLARTLLQDEAPDRKAIFRRIKPQINESYGEFYQRKFAAFFGIVEGLTRAEFSGLLAALERVDAAIKTTEVPPKTAFEAFLFEYCRLGKKRKPISRPWA